MKTELPEAKSILEPPTLLQSCVSALRIALGREALSAGTYDKYHSLAMAVREKLMEKGLATEAVYKERQVKRVHYFSLEFLMGRTLQNAVINLDLEEDSRNALRVLGEVLEDVYDEEHDAALGNGGLGRLAACFLDSMATLGLPAAGYGIRYDFGMFNQVIEGGYQIEKPDSWLFLGNPWETRRPDEMVCVRFYGNTRHYEDKRGRHCVAWENTEDVMALPYESLIPGYRNDVANPLILWTAKPTEEFNLDYFNHGDYFQAVRQKVESEVISRVLYPNDNVDLGRELRLKQQYFFVSASIQRILNEYLMQGNSLHKLADKVAIHLNDTHPTVAIPELMRLLMDQHRLSWDEAWKVTTETFAYTNHTLLSEALEEWDVSLFGRLLPRHLEIIYEINHRFLKEVKKRFPGDRAMVRDLSLINEHGGKKVRMAHLAVVGSHSVNGVAELHTRLLKDDVLHKFEMLQPGKINNKTNGVTQRRWLLQANPSLAKLITESIGDGWITRLDELKKLERFREDPGFLDTWAEVKNINKRVLAAHLKRKNGFDLNPESLFDVQVKRIHEYKRQLLNILQVIARYLRLRDRVEINPQPRTVMIGGKAAPGYYMAKLIIKLANDVASVINADPFTRDQLKLVFLPNYCVSMAERIFPGSDLSEQISTAGKEASGTGNMKFALNGALTIGTLDGANIEIKDAVGEDNIFIFGLTVLEIAQRRAAGYHPKKVYKQNDELRRVLDLIRRGFFSPDQPDRFEPIIQHLLDYGDPYMVLADFKSYMDCQSRVDTLYKTHREWSKKSVTNVANMGFFSSDRTVLQYAKEIWGIEPVL